MPQPLHQCQIVNSTGNTILLKIIGHDANANYRPDIPGVQVGLMFANPPHNVDLHKLVGGERVVIVWKSDGSSVLAHAKIRLTAPATIDVKLSGPTLRYSIDAADNNGHSILVTETCPNCGTDL